MCLGIEKKEIIVQTKLDSDVIPVDLEEEATEIIDILIEDFLTHSENIL